MTAFDYLHAPRPAVVRKMLEARVPERLHNPLLALGLAIAVVVGAWGIESYRLQSAVRLEERYQQRFDQSRRELARTKVFYSRLQRLVALDKQIAAIVRSGDDDARRLAEIANRLPERAWLTSISRDATGISLEGRAENLRVVSRTMGALAQSRVLRNPVLLDASSSGRGGDQLFHYQVHVDGAKP
ncbi:MAG: PilN domain-containing protein [Vulcanimicrobiaceae bacterium]